MTEIFSIAVTFIVSLTVALIWASLLTNKDESDTNL